MKISNPEKLKFKGLLVALSTTAMMLLSAGCTEIDGGEIRNTVVLPTDSIVNFACANEGVFDETCVLDNPANPYVNVTITEPREEEPGDECKNIADPTSKFTLSDGDEDNGLSPAPSSKSKYYVWATALARGVGLQGENQYFTAFYLHALYAESGSPTTREQALKAYRSLLDNYFSSVTFDKFPIGPNPDCPGFDLEVKVAAALKDRVGENLYAPTDAALIPLFASPDLALNEISDWGYIYDPDTGIMSTFQ